MAGSRVDNKPAVVGATRRHATAGPRPPPRARATRAIATRRHAAARTHRQPAIRRARADRDHRPRPKTRRQSSAKRSTRWN